MSFSVNKNDCKFYVNEEQRKVVCVIPNTKWFALRFVEQYNLQVGDYLNTREMLMMPNSFSGVATCHPEDKFNVNIGELIAYNKARRKMNVSFFKRLNTFVNKVDDRLNLMMDECNAYGDKQADREEKREQKIKEYFGE